MKAPHTVSVRQRGNGGRGPKLTTTSYVILGLLAIKPWSAYELANQISRGVRFFWARAQSNVYAEAKRLVAAKLATSATSYTGNRRTTTYQITERGVAALVEWLDAESPPPTFESESLLKVWFAENASKSVLLKQIETVEEQALAALDLWRSRADELLQHGGIFPERVHINALIVDYMLSQAEAARDWARRAREEVGLWRNVRDRSRGAVFLEGREEGAERRDPA